MPITNIAHNAFRYTVELGVSAKDLTRITLDNNNTAYMQFCLQEIGCVCSLCNPRDHCTHSLCQDCYTVELITSNLPTYLHMGTTLWLGVVLYALVPETMHGIIVGKRVRTRQLSDRYCTRVWMSGMFWCDQ